jgi:hypothetical protein
MHVVLGLITTRDDCRGIEMKETVTKNIDKKFLNGTVGEKENANIQENENCNCLFNFIITLTKPNVKFHRFENDISVLFSRQIEFYFYSFLHFLK